MCDGPLPSLSPSSLSIKCLPQNKTESLEFYDAPSFLGVAGGGGWIINKTEALLTRTSALTEIIPFMSDIITLPDEEIPVQTL